MTEEFILKIPKVAIINFMEEEVNTDPMILTESKATTAEIPLLEVFTTVIKEVLNLVLQVTIQISEEMKFKNGGESSMSTL